jgi:hypothetical protein
VYWPFVLVLVIVLVIVIEHSIFRALVVASHSRFIQIWIAIYVPSAAIGVYVPASIRNSRQRIPPLHATPHIVPSAKNIGKMRSTGRLQSKQQIIEVLQKAAGEKMTENAKKEAPNAAYQPRRFLASAGWAGYRRLFQRRGFRLPCITATTTIVASSTQK